MDDSSPQANNADEIQISDDKVSMVYVLHSFPVFNFHFADIFPNCFQVPCVFQLSLFYPFINGVVGLSIL